VQGLPSERVSRTRLAAYVKLDCAKITRSSTEGELKRELAIGIRIRG